MLIIYGLRIVNVFKHRWKFERSKKIMKNIGDETKYKTHKSKRSGLKRIFSDKKLPFTYY